MQQSELTFHRGICAGVDEAGRGPLAGPVVAAAVILDSGRPIAGLNDSKKLSAHRRELLAEKICQYSLSWAVAWADAAEIDKLNILNATMLAMRRAILGLRLLPESVVVDGNRLPSLRFHQVSLCGEAVVGGDARIPAISAASILAKVTRDRMMRHYDGLFPGYGFSQHKGYGTVAHRTQIELLGPCDLHRRSFEPVRSMTP
jgi:ribonuclease HII